MCYINLSHFYGHTHYTKNSRNDIGTSILLKKNIIDR
jgi:hypothetical protein